MQQEMSRLITFVGWIICSLVCAEGQEQAELRGKLLSLPYSAHKPVYDTLTGSIFALNDRGNELIRISSDLLSGEENDNTGIKKVATPINSVFLLSKNVDKKSFVVVISSSERQAWIYDGKEVSLIKRIHLEFEPGSVTSSSDPMDAAIYFAPVEKRNNSRIHTNRIEKFDLNEFSFSSHFTEFPFDADRTMLAIDKGTLLLSNSSSEVGMFTLKARMDGTSDPVDFEFVRSIDIPDRSALSVDPFNQFVASQRSLGSIEGSSGRSLRQSQFLTFHPQIPCRFEWQTLLLRQHGDAPQIKKFKITAVSNLNDEELGDVHLPATHQIFARERGSVDPSQIRLFADHERNRVILGGERAVLVLSENVIIRKSVPNAFLRIAGPRKSKIGDPVEISVSAPDPLTSFRLISSPKGVTFHNGVVKWHDQPIGTTSISFEVAHGITSFVQRWSHTVSYPHCRIPISATQARITKDGAYAFLWSPEKHQGGSTVVTMDLNRMIQVAKIELKRSIGHVEISGDKLVIAEHGKGALDIYQIPDLKREKSRFLEGRIEGVEVMSGGDVVVILQKGNTISRDWISVRLSAGNYAPSDGQPIRSKRLPKRMGDSWHFTDRVLDGSMRNVIALLPESSQFRSLTPHRQRLTEFVGPVLWGRVAQGEELRTMSGKRVALPANGEVKDCQILEDFPVAVSLNANREKGLMLGLHDLVSGEASNYLQFAENRTFFSGNQGFLGTKGQRIIACVSGTIWRIDLEKEDLRPALSPAEIESMQSSFFVREDNVELNHIVKGGEPPYKFELLHQGSGQTIDSGTGIVSINWEAAASPVLKEKLGFVLNTRTFSSEYHARNYERNLEVLSQFSRRLDDIGIKRRDNAFYVPLLVSVGVSDKNGQASAFNYVVHAEIPKSLVTTPKDVQKKVASSEAKKLVPSSLRPGPRSSRNDSESVRRLQVTQRSERGEAKPNSTDTSNRKLQQIESRLKRMEDLLDGVLRKLDELSKQTEK